jgi:hypothetical protein
MLNISIGWSRSLFCWAEAGMRIDNRATIAGAKILTGAKVLNGLNMSYLRELVTGSPPKLMTGLVKLI